MIRRGKPQNHQLKTLDDIALCVLAREGNRDALDVLLRRHYDRVYMICRRICCSETDALDAAQETLINVTRRLDRFDGLSTFSTWLYRVTTNTCLDELRRRNRRPEPIDPHEHTERTLVLPSEEDAIIGQIDIDEALAQLPSKFRVVVVLRDVLGLDYEEIGRVLDLPPGTVRSQIARGRKRLADWFGNQQPSPERLTTRTSTEPHRDETVPHGRTEQRNPAGQPGQQ